MIDARHHVVPSLAARGHLAMTEPEMVAWGERLGGEIKPPLIITLAGELGAGKTTLAQAICRGYGVEVPVTSPTYALVHEYVAPQSVVYHVDLYRLSDERGLTQIGWSDFISSRALILVEWPERAASAMPAGHLPIVIDYDPVDAARRLLLAG